MQQAYWLGCAAGFALGEVANHGYDEFDCVNLDLARIADAWQKLIERHDMLRAVVLPNGTQKVLPEVGPFHLEVLDLRTHPENIVQARLHELRDRLSHEVRPPDRWPLVNVRATLLDRGHTRLHFSIDGLVVDGWSCRILFSELRQLYRDPRSNLNPIEYSFRDFVLAEARMKDDAEYRRSLLYWQKRLHTLPPAPALPVVCRPAGPPRFVRRTGTLAPEDWHRLKQWTTRAGLSPADVVLAAYAEVLSTWSESPWFTLTVPISNRPRLHPHISRIVGEFISFVLLEANCSGHISLADRARALRRQLWRDLDHWQVSGVALLRELASVRGRPPGPMFPVVFSSNLASAADAEPLAGIGTSVYHVTQTPQVWLDHLVTQHERTLVIEWDAVDAVFPPGMLDDMLEMEMAILRSLASAGTKTSHVSDAAALATAQSGPQRVLKPSGAPCPVWVPGQIHQAAADGRFRATSEIGRRLPGGHVEIMGVNDMCPVVDGRYVAASAIENLLRRHEAIKEAVVAVEGEGAGARLIAYVEPRPEETTPGTLRYAAERVVFKLSEPGLRESPAGEREIKLADGKHPASWYMERRSHRRFDREALGLERLGRWFGALRAMEVEQAPVPKYRYASGGGLYAVRVYLGVRAGAVEGVGAGGYYYHPRRHALVQVWNGDLGGPGHAPINEELARQAGLTLFLVAVREVVEAMYGDAWREFCLLEAGGIAQLLMSEGSEAGIGMCPLGRVDFDAVRPRLGLAAGEELLHTLVAGPIRAAQQTARGWVEELTATARALESPRSMEQRLKAYLRERLPEYMLPAAIVVVEQLPLTDQSRVDRSALSRLSAVPHNSSPTHTDAERAIMRVCAELVGRHPRSADDNLFDVGANSLHVIQMRQRLEEHFKREIPVVDLFRHTSIRTLAASITGDAVAESSVHATRDRAGQHRASRARLRSSRLAGRAGGPGGDP
jgi:SagB-type dehydrogenase family enzyme